MKDVCTGPCMTSERTSPMNESPHSWTKVFTGANRWRVADRCMNSQAVAQEPPFLPPSLPAFCSCPSCGPCCDPVYDPTPTGLTLVQDHDKMLHKTQSSSSSSTKVNGGQDDTISLITPLVTPLTLIHNNYHLNCHNAIYASPGLQLSPIVLSTPYIH